MNWSPAVIAPLFGAAAALATLLATAASTAPPKGRRLYALVLLCTSLLLVWLSGFLGELQPLLTASGFQAAVVSALLILPPAIVALSIRLGQGEGSGGATGIVPVSIATVASVILGIWIVGGTESSLQTREGGSLVLALAPGPARATAVLLLLSGCYAIVRFQATLEAARRAGNEVLGRALVGPLFATVALVLTTSQLLLYGALPLELVSIGSLVVVPTSIVTWPILAGRNRSKASLPNSARIQTSGLLLLGLGLFLVSLAALGQVVHQMFPERGFLWFRYGGTAVLLLFALLSLVPNVRGPLSEYFDRSLYAQRWDFRHEWQRANRACAPAATVSELVQRTREFLDEILGPTSVAIWIPDEGGPDWIPIGSGSIELGSLGPDNPLRRTVSDDPDVVEMIAERPHRFSDIPGIVENLTLVEERSFRIFYGMRVEGECISILGLAPPRGFQLDREHRVLLRNFGGQLGNTLASLLPSRLPDPSPTPAQGRDHV